GLTLYAEWKDLIATGVWQLEATDIEMNIDEFLAFVDLGTITEEIIQRSQARAWNTETGATIGAVTVDFDTMEQVCKPGTYTATLMLAPNDSMETQTYTHMLEQPILSRQITIALTEHEVITTPNNEPSETKL